MKEKNNIQTEENQSPILGSWKNLYLVVLAWLIVQVAIFFAITFSFS
jgi:hypothetical protein